MAKRSKSSSKTAGLVMPSSSREERAAVVAHRQSGAAGIHSDQKTRRNGTGKTNRVGSRSSQRRAAIDMHGH